MRALCRGSLHRLRRRRSGTYARGTPFSERGATPRADALTAGDDRYPSGDVVLRSRTRSTQALARFSSPTCGRRVFSPYLPVEAPSGAVLTNGDYGRDRLRLGAEVAFDGDRAPGRSASRQSNPAASGQRIQAAAGGATPRRRAGPCSAPRSRARRQRPAAGPRRGHDQPSPGPGCRSRHLAAAGGAGAAGLCSSPRTEGIADEGHQGLKDYGRYADTQHPSRAPRGNARPVELGYGGRIRRGEVMLFAPERRAAGGGGGRRRRTDDQGFWHARIQVELEYDRGVPGRGYVRPQRRRTGSYVLRVHRGPGGDSARPCYWKEGHGWTTCCSPGYSRRISIRRLRRKVNVMQPAQRHVSVTGGAPAVPVHDRAGGPDRDGGVGAARNSLQLAGLLGYRDRSSAARSARGRDLPHSRGRRVRW